MIKKSITTILTIVLLINCFSLSVTAYNQITNIEQFEDGTYIIVSVSEEYGVTAFSTAKVKNATKTYTYKDASGNILWQFILTGKFEYDGTTSNCKGVSKSTANIADGWRLDTYAIWADANMAKGEAVFKKKVLLVDVKTCEINLNITCDKNGNIS